MPQRAVVGLHFEIRRVHRIRPSWRRIISLRRHYQRRGAQSPAKRQARLDHIHNPPPLITLAPLSGWSSLRRPRPHAAQAAPPTSRKATYRSRTATAGLGREEPSEPGIKRQIITTSAANIGIGTDERVQRSRPGGEFSAGVKIAASAGAAPVRGTPLSRQ